MSAFGKPGQRGLTKLYSNYRARAVQKLKVEFSLNRELFASLTTSACFYCSANPQSVIKGRKSKVNSHAYINGFYTYNGLDRVDNRKGYSVENSVPCCEKCNAMKNGCSLEIARKMLRFVGEIE